MGISALITPWDFKIKEYLSLKLLGIEKWTMKVQKHGSENAFGRPHLNCNGLSRETNGPGLQITEAFSSVPLVESALPARNGVKCFSHKVCFVLLEAQTCFSLGLLLSKWPDHSLKQNLGSSSHSLSPTPLLSNLPSTSVPQNVRRTHASVCAGPPSRFEAPSSLLIW